MRQLLLLIFLFPLLQAQQSRIELKSHFSATLGTNKQYNIFFPEGYDSETDRYPVVYLFRGAVDEWVDPSEDGSRRGTIKTVFDSLYSKKKVGKMILVMPGLGAPASANEYLYIANELIPLIDSLYRTIPSRWHRAMDGFSLGGLIVTNLLAGAPHLFASVGSYDGTLSLFDNSKFSNASGNLIYQIKQMRLLYHTASNGGNNNSNNQTTFNILNAKGIYNFLPSFVLHPTSEHNWFFADWHMAITLPLHWEKIQSASNDLYLWIKSPSAGQIVSGNTMVEWGRWKFPGSIQTRLFYSKDEGNSWNLLHTSTNADSSFQWNTLPHPDGTKYRLKIIAAKDSLFGFGTINKFTINNPGNGTPEIDFVGLNAGDTIAGSYVVKWFAADPDADAVTVSVSVSHNGGSTWQSMTSSLPNTGSYLFNSRVLANGSNIRLRLSVSDGNALSEILSPKLIIHNKRINLQNAEFTHLSGKSDASLYAFGMWAESLGTANYTITFKESEGKKTYSVLTDGGVEVVKDAPELDGKTEGPPFNGFRLLIEDFPVPVINNDSTRWQIGSSTLSAVIKLIDIVTESGTITAKPFPADYEIRFENSVVDTSLALYGASAQPLNFLVWNKTFNRKTKFIFVEIDGNGFLSRNDELYFMEPDSSGSLSLSWHLQFVGNETATNPVSGDRFAIKVMKPLTSNDVYKFIFYPPLSAGNKNLTPDKFQLSQNYPNPFNPETKIEFSLPNAGRATVIIHDVLGRVVETIFNGNLSSGNHSVRWNASRFPSGMYYYTLAAGRYFETKKMVLLK